MAEFRRLLVVQGKLHCLAKLTLYVHISHVCDGLYYTSWRVKATLRYRFKTLDPKPRSPKQIRRQSYIGPPTVGPDNIMNKVCTRQFNKIYIYIYIYSDNTDKLTKYFLNLARCNRNICPPGIRVPPRTIIPRNTL